MRILSRIAGGFRMTDEAWRRHANPWSVWTRFAAIPAMILAVWSRVWIGWWACFTRKKGEPAHPTEGEPDACPAADRSANAAPSNGGLRQS